MFLEKVCNQNRLSSRPRGTFLRKVNGGKLKIEEWALTKDYRKSALALELMGYSTWNRLIKTIQNPRLTRVASDYIFTINPEEDPVFDYADVISLWMLRTKHALLLINKDPLGDKGLVQYYADAYASLINALKLEDSLTEWLIKAELFDVMEQLIRIRAKAINYQDEFGGVILGDPWSWTKESEVLRKETVVKLKRNYTYGADLLLDFLQTIDLAIAEALKWKIDGTVNLSILTASWDFPNVDMVQDANMP